MSTQTSSDLVSFQTFLQHEINRGATERAEDVLRRFRERQRDLERLRQDIQPALDQLDRGEGEPLDMDAIRKEVLGRFGTGQDSTKCR